MNILKESERTITLWHGGKSLESDYMDLKPQKAGRWEFGPGLYLTTNRNTALKYAKGGRRLYKVTIREGTNIEDVKIDLDTAIEFVRRYVKKTAFSNKGSRNIIDDLKENNARMGYLGIEILVNLCINYEALNSSGVMELRRFLIDNGVDYAISRYGGGGEKIVVVINPRIIKKVEVTSQGEVSSYDDASNWGTS